eukprot:89242-Chlamydomonas_euryale.AAC.2
MPCKRRDRGRVVQMGGDMGGKAHRMAAAGAHDHALSTGPRPGHVGYEGRFRATTLDGCMDVGKGEFKVRGWKGGNKVGCQALLLA